MSLVGFVQKVRRADAHRFPVRQITAAMHTQCPSRVISLGGDRGRGPVYVRSTSDRVEILCTAVKDAKCQEETFTAAFIRRIEGKATKPHILGDVISERFLFVNGRGGSVVELVVEADAHDIVPEMGVRGGGPSDGCSPADHHCGVVRNSVSARGHRGLWHHGSEARGRYNALALLCNTLPTGVILAV